MAKKRMTILKLRQICPDGERSWVELPMLVACECGIAFGRSKRGEFMYVQGEDAHTLMEMKLEKKGYDPRYTPHEVPDFKAWLKGATWPTAGELYRVPHPDTVPISYGVTYTLVLKNTGNGYEGCTFAVLSQVVNDAITSMYVHGSKDLSTMQSLLVIKEQLRVEFNKYNEGRE